MSDERAVAALERIERALNRIETAGSARPAASAPADDGELRALRDAHDALRGKVEGAIAQIDRLLENGKG